MRRGVLGSFPADAVSLFTEPGAAPEDAFIVLGSDGGITLFLPDALLPLLRTVLQTGHVPC